MEESPLKVWEKTAEARTLLELRELRRRRVEAKDRSRFRQTRRDKAWALREDDEHRVELWHFVKKRKKSKRLSFLKLCIISASISS